MTTDADRSDSATFAIPGYGSESDFMREMRERFDATEEHWGPQYRRAAGMMKFAFMPDAQWDDWMTRQRAGRPKYTFNKVRQAIKQVTNDQRKNRPQPKFHAVGNSDRPYAEVREGLCRSIERTSNADRAYDSAFQYAVGGGYGVWRIDTEYADDGAFEQDIFIREVANPYAVLFDPAAKEKDRRDGRFLFFKDTVSRAEYKRRWPNKDISEFESQPWSSRWCNGHEVTICEYWFKVRKTKTIIQLSDGRITNLTDVDKILDELAAQGITEVQRRDVEYDEVRQVIVSGAHILEGPTDWAGKFIPFVPVWGEIFNLDGKDYFFGMTDYAADAQRCYNYERSTLIETIAEQPKSPYMATPAMIEGHEEQYEGLATQNRPVLLYNVDPDAPTGGRPMREPPPAFPAALANAAQMSNDDIKATTGKFDASLGSQSNETSGRAIIARQREGDVSSFDFIDNLAYAQKYSYEIINDLIPHVIDTPRQIAIIGPDEKEKVIAVNQPVFDAQSGTWQTPNDFNRGRFAVGVVVGPSFTTQRLETADAMMSLSNDPSPIGLLAKYQFLKSLDTPGMDELMKGARKFLVAQGLIEPDEQDGPPPEPPPPNPADVAAAKKDMASAENQAAQAELARSRAAAIAQEADRQVVVDHLHLRTAGALPPGGNTPVTPALSFPGGLPQDSPVTPVPGGYYPG